MKLHLDLMKALEYGGIALVSLGAFLAIATSSFADVTGWRPVQRYTSQLDRTLRLLFMEGSGKAILRCQAIGIGLVLCATLVFGSSPYVYGLIALIAGGPMVHLVRERQARVKRLEAQVDGFILGLANSMKTVPGPAAALQALMPVLQNPFRQEVQVVLKEMRVGNTLEQAILNMSARIGSKTVDSALSSVLVGLQVGGNLPAVLELTASTIREMNRLDGVIRTKTSEGRAQLWVLALFPFLICAAFNWVQPGYFDPLQKSVAGYVIMAVAMTLWMGSLLMARKVLAVDV